MYSNSLLYGLYLDDKNRDNHSHLERVVFLHGGKNHKKRKHK